MQKARVFVISILFLLAACAAQTYKPGYLKYNWLNGKWENHLKTMRIELKVINGNELTGWATLRYSDPRPGEVYGELKGKIVDDEDYVTIEFSVDWPRGRTYYILERQRDGSLLAPAGPKLDLVKIV